MSRGGAVGLLAIAAVVACAVAACRQLVGIGDAPPSGPPATGADGGSDAGVCGLPYDGTCGACVEGSCCAEATACAGSPACAPFATCVAACQGDPACRATCTTTGPLPRNSPELAALSACLVASCETPCGLLCGAYDYFSMPGSAASCQTCIRGDSDLCSVGTACGSLAACHAFAQCSVACQSLVDCRQACVTTLATQPGGDLVAAVLQGANAECNTQCAVGSDWQCLGHVNNALPIASSTTMTVQLLGLAGGPMPGLDVALCASGSCGEPTTTDVTGTTQVVVSLPLEEPGPTGYLQLSTPSVAAGAPSIPPYLFYWGFPLSRAEVSFTSPGADAGPAALAYTEVAVATVDDVQGLLQLLQVQQDPARGYLSVGIKDCVGSLASGVQFESPQFDGMTQVFYESSGEGNVQFSTDATATLSPGSAVFTNVPTGPLDLTATLAQGQQVVATAHVDIQQGAVTSLYLAPTP